MTRRLRPLTPEERWLWAQVARGVRPLRERALEPEPFEEPAGQEVAASAAPRLPRPPQTPVRKTPPPLAPLERRTVSALRRGRRDIEAAIDLHGLRQADAHNALRAFLHRSQAAGLKVVLVVTGKGAAGGGGPFEERGVLRRVVPHWLRLSDLRPLVVGFEEAAPHHGGAGALYVRLRRSRSSA